MKKILMFAILAIIGLTFAGCSSSEGSDEGSKGSLYGILTAEGSAEPMRAMRVELWKDYSYLTGTVTSDDGQYEFSNLIPDNSYELRVNAEGYEELVYAVTIEGGQRRRADLQLKKLNTHMTVRTLDASDLNGTSVTLNGEVSFDNYAGNPYRPKEAGFFYSTSSSPLSGTRVTGQLDGHSFTASLTNLASGKYYIQAYVKNPVGTAYGEVKTFEITSNPIVSTLDATNVLANTATLNGKIESAGEPAYTERGFVYSRSYNQPTVNDPESSTTKVIVSGSDLEFSVNVASLIENSIYYVRAYATNVRGTAYGDVVTFVPKAPLPIVVTLDATNILETSATLNGRIEDAGEPAYSERGFVYSNIYETPSTTDPTSATNKVVVSGTSREFSANVASLATGENYYVRAYATSAKGTSYGTVVRFKPESSRYIIIENLMVQREDLASAATWKQAYELCENSRVGGYDDWRLPTMVEFNILYKYKDEIGVISTSNVNYWSSDASYTQGYYGCFNFYNGIQGSKWLSTTLYVRAVRSL